MIQTNGFFLTIPSPTLKSPVNIRRAEQISSGFNYQALGCQQTEKILMSRYGYIHDDVRFLNPLWDTNEPTNEVLPYLMNNHYIFLQCFFLSLLTLFQIIHYSRRQRNSKNLLV